MLLQVDNKSVEGKKEETLRVGLINLEQLVHSTDGAGVCLFVTLSSTGEPFEAILPDAAPGVALKSPEKGLQQLQKRAASCRD